MSVGRQKGDYQKDSIAECIRRTKRSNPSMRNVDIARIVGTSPAYVSVTLCRTMTAAYCRFYLPTELISYVERYAETNFLTRDQAMAEMITAHKDQPRTDNPKSTSSIPPA